MTAIARRSLLVERLDLDLKTWGPFLALLALVALGAAINPAFLGAANLENILTRSAFIGIIAIGTTFVITAGGIDLSVGSMAAFIAGVMIIVMNALVDGLGAGWGTIAIGIGVAALLGTFAGFANGLLTTRGKIEAFIVTQRSWDNYRQIETYFAVGDEEVVVTYFERHDERAMMMAPAGSATISLEEYQVMVDEARAAFVANN